MWGRLASPALRANLLGDADTQPYAVYLPPGYEAGHQRYPVIYVLHGFGQAASALTNMAPTIDALIADGSIGPLIAIFPDCSNALGGCWYQSSATIGDYETFFTRDLVQHIDATYRTLADRDHRGITGYSMGAYGALRLALKYPDIYGAVVGQAGVYDIAFDLQALLADTSVTYAATVAEANPKDLREFNGLDRNARGVLSMAAAMAPNPDRPPLFLDKPYRMVGGKVEGVPDVIQRMAAHDVLHTLESYAQQPQRLNGILIVHGALDLPQRAQRLDDAMTRLQVEHEYFAHEGGHLFIPEKSLQFLWDHIGVK